MTYSRIERGLMAADVVGRHFTQISNDFFRDPRLSAAAKGVFGFISTHRHGYGITPELIAKHMRSGVTAIKAALRELEKCGYLTREQTRNPDGTMGRSVYKITDMPDGLAVVESAPHPESRFPSSEPSDGIQPAAPTCENASGEIDLPKQSFPRSEPSDGNPLADYPLAGEPLAGNRMHKNTSHKNTSDWKKTREEPPPPPPTSSVPDRERDGGRVREEEGHLAASNDGQPPVTPVSDLDAAHVILDKAVELWMGHRRPSASERSRLVQRIAKALAEGVPYTGILHALTRDLEPEQVRTSAVQVVMSRTAQDGWAQQAPIVQAPQRPPRPDWCGECSKTTRQREDDEGRPYRCPVCHPLAD